MNPIKKFTTFISENQLKLFSDVGLNNYRTYDELKEFGKTFRQYNQFTDYNFMQALEIYCHDSSTYGKIDINDLEYIHEHGGDFIYNIKYDVVNFL